jgi:hypothetical protein
MDNQTNGSDEREFLHDIASPIGTAILLGDSLLEDFQNRSTTDPDDLTRLVGIFQSLEKIQGLLEERRATLVNRGVPSGRK